MLSVVYFTKYFKHYLLGRRFTIRTDHGFLTWLKNFKEPDGQIHRWIQQLSQFYMKIVHRPGSSHGNADAMSRLTGPESEICQQCKMPRDYQYDGPEEVIIECRKEGADDQQIQTISDEDISDNDAEFEGPSMSPNNGDDSGPMNSSISGETQMRRGRKINRPQAAKQKPEPKLSINYATLQKEQEDDSILGKIFKLKEEGAEKPQNSDITAESPEFKFWIARWEILEIKNGVLCILWEDQTRRWRICAPKSIVKTIMWHLHDSKISGHLGIKKTIEKSKLYPFYWWGMIHDAKEYVQKCEICEERKNPSHRKRHLLKKYIVGGPFERIATDIAGPFPTTVRKHGTF